MTKAFMYGILLIPGLISCSGYRMLEGKSKPVYFTPDSSVFADTTLSELEINYSDLVNLRGSFVQVVELKKGESSKAIIQEPTFFYLNNSRNEVLVYPKEHIVVKKDDFNDYIFSDANGNLQRNRELLFFKTFNELEKYPIFPSVLHPSLQTILEFEKQQKEKIIKTQAASRTLFDSLVRVYNLSKKFKRLTKDYLENRYAGSLFYLYREKEYKDTLLAHDLYAEKLKQLIPVFNGITKRSKFNYQACLNLNEFVGELFPYEIWRIEDEAEFESCFDTLATHFTALVRDYLLSRLIYRACIRGIQISPVYLKKYKRYSIDKAYRKTVYNTINQRKRNNKNRMDSVSSRLLAADAKTIYNFETVLAAHKGQYVLVDFWATWCLPCREETPYLKEIIKKYPGNQIAFLNISIDREIQVWRKAMIANNSEKNNYLLLDYRGSSLFKQFDFNTIPRYILFDKEGKVINADAPNPSDPALTTLLDKLIF